MTRPALTPGKHPFTLPSQALEAAIAAEWQGRPSFNAAAMPLTALAFTAIDRVASARDSIIEVMLAYVDTDALCYRSRDSRELQNRQHKEWDPLLAWAGHRFSALWQTTSGVMPLVQSPALHQSIRSYLEALDDFGLAGVSVLASLLSSLVLAAAVYDRRISTGEAFRLSRLEEHFQAENWGEDAEAKRREDLIFKEVEQVTKFLDLLGQAASI